MESFSGKGKLAEKNRGHLLRRVLHKLYTCVRCASLSACPSSMSLSAELSLHKPHWMSLACVPNVRFELHLSLLGLYITWQGHNSAFISFNKGCTRSHYDWVLVVWWYYLVPAALLKRMSLSRWLSQPSPTKRTFKCPWVIDACSSFPSVYLFLVKSNPEHERQRLDILFPLGVARLVLQIIS